MLCAVALLGTDGVLVLVIVQARGTGLWHGGSTLAYWRYGVRRIRDVDARAASEKQERTAD